jgi:hypothetical protein
MKKMVSLWSGHIAQQVRQEELSTVESWIVYLRDAGTGRGGEADDAWDRLGNIVT